MSAERRDRAVSTSRARQPAHVSTVRVRRQPRDRAALIFFIFNNTHRYSIDLFVLPP